MKILPQLIAPLTVDRFLTEYWTEKAVHIAANQPQKFRDIFSWYSLNNLLNYHQLTEPEIRFSKQGKILPQSHERQHWSDRIRAGATMILNGVHHRVPSVTQLAAHLRQDLGSETHVNSYCSPADQQGFDCHYDTHDVLILQIDGEKEWFVYSETVPFPTTNMDSQQYAPPEADPYIHCILKPGDLLYIPRGHWHYAIACNQLSLHLTVGIEPQTGLDWLAWLGRELQQNPLWRKTLPLSIDGTTALEQQLLVLRDHLIATLQQPDQLHQYIEMLSDRCQPPFLVSLPEQIGVDIFSDGLMTQYCWSPLHRIRVQQLGEEHYQVRIGSKQFDLKGVPTSLIESIFNQDEFTLLELADWAPDLDLEADVVPLIRRFVTEGALQVKPNR